MSEPPDVPATVAAQPPMERLTKRQRHGADCLYCAVTLRPGDVVDLGGREAEDGTVWSPRAHPRCVKGARDDERAG
ncbi:hypothetical protein [Streptomyces sp. AK02-01A]|uniref:hypothetical protein n=1 Tax=Streptomyces sp. AK02-01A TaxID=3028648 RepID=UPI0029A0BAC5|nr:hypothetical protein [Streptomyces sp. AK02-01A]MDX3851399.1 hypothetical protein [Streptomyces sp. AK02-01A]